MKYIELSTSKKARICRALGVSRVTLWSALTFQTQSQLAEKIRRMVRLEFDNATCTASISRDNRAVKTFSDVKVRDWGNIVFEAQSLTDSLNR